MKSNWGEDYLTNPRGSKSHADPKIDRPILLFKGNAGEQAAAVGMGGYLLSLVETEQRKPFLVTLGVLPCLSLESEEIK